MSSNGKRIIFKLPFHQTPTNSDRAFTNTAGDCKGYTPRG